MDRITAVCIRNPFLREESREIRHFEPGLLVKEVLHEFYEEIPEYYDIVVSVDGLILADPYERKLNPGETILFCAKAAEGGGKDILAAVAMLAVIVAAPYAGAWVAQEAAILSGTGFTIGTYTAIGSVATGLGIVAGAALVSAVFQPNLPSLSAAKSVETSPTYSWEPGQNATIEGVAHPRLYGTHRVTPPIIGWYVETSGMEQYLNVLLEVAGHSLDSIVGERINRNPVHYFEGVHTEVRLGNINQPVIQKFEDVRDDVPVNTKLDWPDDWDSGTTYDGPSVPGGADGDIIYYEPNLKFYRSKQDNNINHTPPSTEDSWWVEDGNWQTRRTTKNIVQGLGIMLGLPKGLFYANNSGGMDEQSVNVEIQFKLVEALAYDSAKTYAKEDVVEYPADTFWRSRVDNNTGHTPQAGTWWIAYTPDWTSYEFWATASSTVPFSYWSAGYFKGWKDGQRIWHAMYPLDYSATKTYELGDIVKDPALGGTFWKSLQDNNTGQTLEEGAYWTDYSTEMRDSDPATAPYQEGDVYAPPLYEWVWNADTGDWVEVRPELIWHYITEMDVFLPTQIIGSYAVVTGATTSPLHKVFYRDNLPEGQWDIRVRFKDKPPVGPRYGNDVYWESFQEIVYDKFERPGISMLAVRALATNRLSGGKPVFDCIGSRLTVPVYNPNTSLYEQKAATNPAWASYDEIHQARYKLNVGTGDNTLPANYEVDGKPASLMIYDEFESWADWCDLMGYTVNIYFDQFVSSRKALNLIGMNGRGLAVQVGRKYGCIVDRPEETPVQRFSFGMGNIAKDSFKQAWMKTEGRATVVEVTYYDATKEWEPQAVTICTPEVYSSGQEPAVAQVNLIGCTDRNLAILHGKNLLNQNRYLVYMASWEADVDSIGCRRSDIIELSHDVPLYGMSGRVFASAESLAGVVTDVDTGLPTVMDDDTGVVVEASAGPVITLDREVTLEPDTDYILRIRHSDTDQMETYNCVQVGSQTTTDAVEIQPGYSRLPAKYDNYAFGEIDKAFRLVRVMDLTRAGDMRRSLSVLEYVPEVFDDAATIPEPEVISGLALIRRLKATEVWRGGAETRVHLSWEGFAIYWNVWHRRGTEAWIFDGVAYSPNFEISGLDYGLPAYQFAVSPTMNINDGLTVSLALVGKTDLPDDVQSVVASAETHGILIEWYRVFNFDLAGYEIRIGSDWETANVLVRTVSNSYRWNVQLVGSYQILVKAYDVFGNYSANAASYVLQVPGPSAVTPSHVFAGENVVLSWTASEPGPMNFSIAEYEIGYGDDYDTDYTFLDSTKALGLSINVDWGGQRRFWITPIDVAGNRGTEASIDVVVIAPGIPSGLSASVIDNNVLLRWSAPATGSLPIRHYNVLKGDTYAEAQNNPVGQKLGTFTVVFESIGGNYTYWVEAVDTADNVSVAAAVTANVDEPPDFVFHANLTVDLQVADRSSAHLSAGGITLPVNTTETYAEHFTNRSWNTPADQVAAGYPGFIMPVPASGYVEEVFELDATIPLAAKIVLTANYPTQIGTPAITPKISVSLNGTSWTDYDNVWQVVESNFKYVKVRLTVDSVGGDDLLLLEKMQVNIGLKEKTESGNVEVTTNGVQVDFATSFFTITSIAPAFILNAYAAATTYYAGDYVNYLGECWRAVQETTGNSPQEGANWTKKPPPTVVYDIDLSEANPTYFNLYLFHSDTGGDASGSGKFVTWTARGT